MFPTQHNILREVSLLPSFLQKKKKGQPLEQSFTITLQTGLGVMYPWPINVLEHHHYSTLFSLDASCIRIHLRKRRRTNCNAVINKPICFGTISYSAIQLHMIFWRRFPSSFGRVVGSNFIGWNNHNSHQWKLQMEVTCYLRRGMFIRTADMPSRSRVMTDGLWFGKTNLSIVPLRQAYVDRSQIMPSFQFQSSTMVPIVLSKFTKARVNRPNNFPD